MFRKLFGATNEEQLQFLKKRLIITVALSVAGAIIAIFNPVGLALIVIALYMWGLPVMKALFGAATLGAIFSKNIVIGIVIFLLYILVGYFGGMFCFILGLCRFVYLITNKIKSEREQQDAAQLNK